VIELPANTGFGAPTVDNATSACAAVPTTSVAVAEFAPKDWFEAFTVTVSLITVPAPVPALTLNTTENVPDDPAAAVVAVHGLAGNPAQVHPAGGVIETKLVFAGVASLNVPFVMADDPVFVTTCV